MIQRRRIDEPFVPSRIGIEHDPTVDRNADEIIRQNKRGLHLYAHSNGQGVDELVGAGCVANLEIAYGGTGKFMSTCLRFKKAIQDQTIKVEDYSNYQMTLRFLAGAMGLPFLPTRSSLGTDIINKWGFPKEFSPFSAPTTAEGPTTETDTWWFRQIRMVSSNFAASSPDSLPASGWRWSAPPWIAPSSSALR